LVSWFSLWNYNHLPLLDFRPYDLGTVIMEEMEFPEGAPVDEYETILTYRNKESGETMDFTLEDYPRDTLQWEFVTSESKLLKKGYEPPIHDFAIMDADGFDMADQILSDRGYSLLMITHNLSGADEMALLKARDWSQIELLADDFSFYAVSSSTSEEVDAVISNLDLGFPFFVADEIMLKTIVRSNPGFVLIRNGAIIGKWGSDDFPSIEEVDPEMPEMIGNAAAPLDEEAQLLMEAGLYEDFSFNVFDFDSLTPELLFEKDAQKKECGVVLAFIMGLVILLLLAQYVSPTKS
ncbi:MAG: hypothetical protein KAT15_10330, partial [Bacteroidales bacterium]|nr:hypothetical protein [Bacteroidales bacterium]